MTVVGNAAIPTGMKMSQPAVRVAIIAVSLLAGQLTREAFEITRGPAGDALSHGGYCQLCALWTH